jgi:hypothetical protein
MADVPAYRQQSTAGEWAARRRNPSVVAGVVTTSSVCCRSPGSRCPGDHRRGAKRAASAAPGPESETGTRGGCADAAGRLGTVCDGSTHIAQAGESTGRETGAERVPGSDTAVPATGSRGPVGGRSGRVFGPRPRTPSVDGRTERRNRRRPLWSARGGAVWRSTAAAGRDTRSCLVTAASQRNTTRIDSTAG